jgi:hypothetical protein
VFIRCDNLITDFIVLLLECYIGAFYLSKFESKLNFFMLYSKIVENVRAFGKYLMTANDNNLEKKAKFSSRI